MQLGFASWTETARAAQDRTNWKTRVRGPILQEERRESQASHCSFTMRIICGIGVYFVKNVSCLPTILHLNPELVQRRFD